MKANMYLSDEEVTLVLTDRAEKMTGYRCHAHNGQFYIWPMGRQPEQPIWGLNPVDAAENFLRLYEPRWGDSTFETPRRRKPLVCPACKRPLDVCQ